MFIIASIYQTYSRDNFLEEIHSAPRYQPTDTNQEFQSRRFNMLVLYDDAASGDHDRLRSHSKERSGVPLLLMDR